MIEKAEDGVADLLGHLMLTAGKLPRNRVLKRATEWSSTMEWRGASRSTTCTSTFLEAGSSTGPLAKACPLVNFTFFSENQRFTPTQFHGLTLTSVIRKPSQVI